MELLNSLLFMLNEMSPYILLGFFIDARICSATYIRTPSVRTRMAVSYQIRSHRYSIATMFLWRITCRNRNAPKWSIKSCFHLFFSRYATNRHRQHCCYMVFIRTCICHNTFFGGTCYRHAWRDCCRKIRAQDVRYEYLSKQLCGLCGG